MCVTTIDWNVQSKQKYTKWQWHHTLLSPHFDKNSIKPQDFNNYNLSMFEDWAATENWMSTYKNDVNIRCSSYRDSLKKEIDQYNTSVFEALKLIWLR